ncbi:MAG: AAA domain-containing protein [Lentisphaeraceae bacterium]|nr:AAA domain-containing protein [Lentisphaeraceae bacterium]
MMQQNSVLSDLKDYQKRENRQSWADYYHRLRSTQAELLKDPEVISSADFSKRINKTDYLFQYSDGEIKLRQDSRVDIFPHSDGNYEKMDALRGVKMKQLEPLSKKVLLSFPNSKVPSRVCIMPTSPLNSRGISDSIMSYTRNSQFFPAPTKILDNTPSQFRELSKPMVSYNDQTVDDIITKATNLDNSHFTIQGPPGTGKTYIGARVIIELILQGRRVGVMALSHKAINNLLLAVDKLVDFYQIRGAEMVKTRSVDNPKGGFNNIRIGDIVSQVSSCHLLGGTVYSFSRMPDNIIDTLVIDEAGQIPLAWIMAAGRTSKNIVLMGDHRQLPQVSQSMHPDGTGESVLEHLMGQNSIIPEEYGVFLNITRRMNAQLTSFISKLMYDDELSSHEETKNYKLNLKCKHSALDSRGISWIEMNHSGCSQESRQEADEIKAIIDELDDEGFPLNEILVIAPYRAQEALLKNLLPKQMSEQIGTVDRFQGREADIVIFSMTSSDGLHLPRDIDFLYSSNRLNVALSRARKKAIILVNRKLLTVSVNNMDQLKLVNSLCRLKKYCESLGN